MSDEKNYDARQTVDIELDFPIEVDATPYISLTMRRPKTKDFIKSAKKAADADKGIALLADLCGVAPNVIAELDDIDAQKLGKQLDAFRGGQSS